ncbi:MAG: NAD(P)-dependent glycerol-3-phosphate dehydrogenase [Chromatiales bacterium]|nr:NAD(P)-dependent glycerol-3-phosphate dehydrogenase [Chromatiales bacterium]
MADVAVIGAGSWGSALALCLARNGHRVRLWAHRREHAEALVREGENRRYLPGVALPESITPTADLATALDGADDRLIVVPSGAFRATLQNLLKHGPCRELAWASKGLEPETGLRLDQVAAELIGDAPIAIVSGPTFATEIARNLPAAATVASWHPAYAQHWVERLHAPVFRTYTTDDPIGVAIGGATKNVLAIAAGITDGLGFGANTRAALITRGLAEMTRLALAFGARAETLYGLAGVGDLVLTCTDDQSRNRRLGRALAKGQTIGDAIAGIAQAVEGYHTVRALCRLAAGRDVEMPIAEQVRAVLFEGVEPKAAIEALLTRDPKAE